jgi:hypothetical protein
MATEEDTWATNIKKELQERPRNPNRDDLASLSNKTNFSFEIT